MAVDVEDVEPKPAKGAAAGARPTRRRPARRALARGTGKQAAGAGAAETRRGAAAGGGAAIAGGERLRLRLLLCLLRACLCGLSFRGRLLRPLRLRLPLPRLLCSPRLLLQAAQLLLLSLDGIGDLLGAALRVVFDDAGAVAHRIRLALRLLQHTLGVTLLQLQDISDMLAHATAGRRFARARPRLLHLPGHAPREPGHVHLAFFARGAGRYELNAPPPIRMGAGEGAVTVSGCLRLRAGNISTAAGGRRFLPGLMEATSTSVIL